MHNKAELFCVSNIVRNIRNSRSFLSTSTRGVESEVHGKASSVSRTIRGLTITLENGKKVVWPIPKKVAEAIVPAGERYVDSL